MRPRCVASDNSGPFTLDGTRTYLVGHRRVAIIDPGPHVPSHVWAVLHAVSEAEHVWVLLTHGHADHAGAAEAVADAAGAEIRGVGVPAARPLADAEAVETDQGRLLGVDTPGHSREHVTFHWPEAEAAFPGDLILGRGDTTWVGEYEGCVADYLESLDALRALRCRVLYPTHGPPVEDPEQTLDAFEAHRRERIRRVREALTARRAATTSELVTEVYGSELSDDRVVRAAAKSVEAIRDFLV